ncbi:MAG: hypothetical protein ACYDAE_18475 [Steroidobacteraceae bacterium]
MGLHRYLGCGCGWRVDGLLKDATVVEIDQWRYFDGYDTGWQGLVFDTASLAATRKIF